MNCTVHDFGYDGLQSFAGWIRKDGWVEIEVSQTVDGDTATAPLTT